MTRPMVWGIRNTALVAKQHILTALTQCSWDTDTVPLSVSILASFALSLFSLTLFRYCTPGLVPFYAFFPLPYPKGSGAYILKMQMQNPKPSEPERDVALFQCKGIIPRERDQQNNPQHSFVRCTFWISKSRNATRQLHTPHDMITTHHTYSRFLSPTL